jgi:cellulose biosynthesis protein BcsQ
VVSTTIREGIAVPESQLAQLPLREYSPKSKPALDYESFAGEVIERTEE